MKMLIDIPEIYAEAYKLMAKDFGRRSRQEIIQEILELQMDKNPGYLHQARPHVAVKQALRKHKENKKIGDVRQSPMTEQDYRDILGEDFEQYKDQLTFAPAKIENLAENRTKLSALEQKVLDEILLEMPELLEPEVLEPKKEEPAAPELGMFPEEGGTIPELPEM
jgi:hypothetical protein